MVDANDQAKRIQLLGIDFVFEMGLRKVDEQLRTIQDIDSKMGILIGFIGTFAALLVGFFLGAAPQRIQTLLSGWTPFFFYPSVLFLLLALVRCFQAFKVRDYFAAFQFPLMVEWANEDPTKIKDAFIGGVLQAVQRNAREIERKRKYANQGTWLMLFVVVFLLLVLVSLVGQQSGRKDRQDNGRAVDEAARTIEASAGAAQQSLQTATRSRPGADFERRLPSRHTRKPNIFALDSGSLPQSRYSGGWPGGRVDQRR